VKAQGVVFAPCRGDGAAGDRDGEGEPGSARPTRLHLGARTRAVVFDLDGVLVDSEGIWAEAEAATVAGLGGEYTQELSAALYGRGHRDGARILAERFGGDADAIADTLLGHALAGFRRGLEPLPGARDLVARLRGRVPIAVASNSARVIVETALASAGLEGFDAVVAGEDVAAAKPAPDPYLEACARLGVAPADAVGVEDSPVGIASAKAAGLYVIGVPSIREQRLDEADLVVASLDRVLEAVAA
jgi:HAD superfamily hydrolase (TIGR01509 family)